MSNNEKPGLSIVAEAGASQKPMSSINRIADTSLTPLPLNSSCDADSARDAQSIERAPTPSPPAPTSPVAVPSRGALMEVAGPSAVASLPVYEERDPDTPIVRSNSNLEMQLREAQLTLEELRQSRANFLDQAKNKIDSALKDHIYSRQIIDDYRAEFDLLPIEIEEQLLNIEEGLDANLASIKEVVQCLQDPELLHQYNWCYSTLAILADLIQAGCK